MQFVCQIILLAALAVRFFGLVLVCFEGRPKTDPPGFVGFFFVLLFVVVHLALLAGAGCLSFLFG